MTDSHGDPSDKSIDASDETSGALTGSQPSSDVEPDAIATSPQPAPETQTSPEPPKSETKAKPVTSAVKPVWWRLVNAATNMALAFANIIMFFSFAGYLSKYWFLCELSSHFRLLYAPFFLVFLIPCLILRRWRLVSIVGTFALINILTIVPLYTGRVHLDKPASSLRVLQANVNRSNTLFDECASVIKNADPDVICLIEMSPAWAEPMNSKLSMYPYRLLIPRPDCFGLGFYSRFPLTETKTLYLDKSSAPTLTCHVTRTGETPIELILTHAMPPRDWGLVAMRNQLFVEVARLTAASKLPCLVIGDLNCTPWSSAFGEFLKQGNLVDTQSGFGPQPSWPSGFSPFPVLPIDHFLSTHDVMTKDRSVLKDLPGSDHYPVLIEVAW